MSISNHAAIHTHHCAKLSNYVVRTDNKLFNTVTKTVLPEDASHADLESNYFLSGQEEASLAYALYKPGTVTGFDIVPTWECNLRCSHCMVLQRLEPIDNNVLDSNKLVDFIHSYADTYKQVEQIKVHFVGGEPLLRTEQCLEIRNKLPRSKRFIYSIITNGVTKLTDLHYDLLTQLDQVFISLDGLKDQNNKQRKAFRSDIDPYETTINTIKELLDNGFRDRLTVQASVRDEWFTKEHKVDFMRELMKLGVKKESIAYGCISPTEKRPVSDQAFINTLKKPQLRHIPCCKYRFMNNFIIDSKNLIYSDFYTFRILGKLGDSLEQISNEYKKVISDEMPALKDPKCMKCPVIGYCWGGCVNGLILIGNRPSAYCDQSGLIDKVETLAKEGKLIHDNSVVNHSVQQSPPEQSCADAAATTEEPKC